MSLVDTRVKRPALIYLQQNHVFNADLHSINFLINDIVHEPIRLSSTHDLNPNADIETAGAM